MKIPAAVLLLPALALAPAAGAATRPFTAHDLVALERVSRPKLSPDGRHVAYQMRQTDLAANKGVTGIWALDLARKGARPRPLTAAGTDSSAPRWGADGRLYFLSARGGSRQVWRLDMAGGEARQVTALPLDVGAFLPAPDGRHLALALEVFPACGGDLACTRQRLDERRASPARGAVHDRLFVRHWDAWKDGTRSQLFLVPLDAEGLAAGTPRLASGGVDGDVPTKPFGDESEWAFTPDGRHLFFAARIAGRDEAWSTNTDLWRVPVDAPGAAVNVTAAQPGYDLAPAVSPDGRHLAWLSMRRAGFEADRFRILVRELPDGEPRELAAGWDRSAQALAWSADSRTLYAVAGDTGQRRIFALALKGGAPRALTGPGFVESFDVGRRVLVYSQDTLQSPAQVFAMDPGGGKARALTDHNAARMAQLALGESEQFRFAGWNGEPVHGYVVKPAGFARDRKYPVAFIIHGGPQTSMGNHWHYRWNPQTYAGAGYAVVFIDFHGSDGYGQAFTDSISGDWGGKPLEDLRKGWAAALERYPFLDGERACALGASYGGFMVNWIAGQWPDGFRCLVNHDGIFDQRAMAYTTEELWFTEWEHGGAAFERPENYEKFNPVNHVAKWKTPMLVIHGGLDYRVPETQGIATFTALQRRGIESRFLHFPNENHWVLKPHNSIQWHTVVEDWLKRWTND